MLKKRIALMLSFAFILIAIVGCGGDKTETTETAPAESTETEDKAKDEDKKDEPATAAEGGELIVGQGADPKSLDPHGTNDQPSSRVSKQIYNTLVNQNENMEAEPGLAESWEISDDGVYTFKLREGVMFHNGEELKASDVAFTLKRGVESTHVGHIIGMLDPEKIEVVDDYTIKLGTKEPFAPLLAHLAHTATAILNEKAVEEFGEDYGQNPVGTGPFKFENWVSGDSVTLARFDDYFEGPAKVEKITFRAIPENTNRTIELETGGIHIAYDIPPTDVTRVEENSDLLLERNMNLSCTYIGFNCEKEPFNDPKVRQAINYALDMDNIVEAVYQGVGKPASGPLGSLVWAANTNLEPYGYNIEKAKELLAEAGYPDGFSTSIWTNENKQRTDIAEIAQNQLKQIGIDVKVEQLEWGAYLDKTAAGEHDMFILGWVTVTGDPDYGLYPLFHSSQHGDAGNRTFYTNEEVDKLLDLGRTSVDEKERENAYMAVQEIVREDAPWVFVWNGEDLTGLRNNIEGFKNHPAGHHKLYNVSFK